MVSQAATIAEKIIVNSIELSKLPVSKTTASASVEQPQHRKGDQEVVEIAHRVKDRVDQIGHKERARTSTHTKLAERKSNNRREIGLSLSGRKETFSTI